MIRINANVDANANANDEANANDNANANVHANANVLDNDNGTHGIVVVAFASAMNIIMYAKDYRGVDCTRTVLTSSARMPKDAARSRKVETAPADNYGKDPMNYGANNGRCLIMLQNYVDPGYVYN